MLTVCHIWPFGVKINRFIFPSAEIRPLNRLFKTLKHFFDKQIEWNPVQLKIQCKSIWDKPVELNQSFDADHDDLKIWCVGVFVRSSNIQSSVTN